MFSFRRRPPIVFATRVFGKRARLVGLPRAVRKFYSDDLRHLAQARAAIFHLPDLFGSPESVASFLRLEKPAGQLWVAWSQESAVNYPLTDNSALAARFDLRMTYRRNADVWAPYIPLAEEWARALKRPPPPKLGATAMFQSAPYNASGRLEFAAALMSRLEVHSYGRMLNNRPAPKPDRGRATKHATIARYKFCLSLENAIEADYVTEKFFDPLLVGTVPIYRGAPNVEDYAPGDRCFIDASKFASVDDLADHVRRLDAEPAAYGEYLAWRSHPLSLRFREYLDAQRESQFVRLARRVLR